MFSRARSLRSLIVLVAAVWLAPFAAAQGSEDSSSSAPPGAGTTTAAAGTGASVSSVADGPAAQPAGYYDSVDTSGPVALRATLHDVIDDHQRFPYTDTTTDTWDILELADEDPNDPTRVLDVYKNESYPKFTTGNDFYEREHSWPKSYGYPKNVVANYPYTDCHALFLANGDYNGSRGNKPYRNCDPALNPNCNEKPTEVNNGAGGGTGVYPGNSNWTVGQQVTGSWETWIDRRGDVARALFYLDVRYEGGMHGVTLRAEPDLILTDDEGLIAASKTGKNETTGYMGMLTVLLEWHAADPVDDRERRRNDVVFASQGNRNPFIDHPEWVDCLFAGACGGQAAVWINEFHYDNAGGDTGEFVEIAGPAGTDLSDWTVYAYNGANGNFYASFPLAGAIPDLEGGFGVLDFATPGLQNGPDALALVDDSGVVVEFLGYEGSFAANDGPALGQTAVDIAVFETTSTPIGDSLQRAGTGTLSGDFVWQPPAISTPGAVNTGQSLGLPAPWINEFHYDNQSGDTGEMVEIAGPAGTDLSGWMVYAYDGNSGNVYDSFALAGTIPDQQGGYGTVSIATSGLQNGPDGLALVDGGGAVVELLSYEGSFTANDGPAAGMRTALLPVSETSSTPAGHSLQRAGTGTQAGDFAWQRPGPESPGSPNTGQTFGSPQQPEGTPWLNEFHYDNDGGDTDEFVEVAGPAGFDLTGWSVQAYNGANGEVYDTIALAGHLPDQGGGFGVLDFDADGLQNGPDGLALVDEQGQLVGFLAYEASFDGTEGPADGETAVDIGVSESPTTPAGESLQKSGTGTESGDFTWQPPQSATRGAPNTGQSFG